MIANTLSKKKEKRTAKENSTIFLNTGQVLMIQLLLHNYVFKQAKINQVLTFTLLPPANLIKDS